MYRGLIAACIVVLTACTDAGPGTEPGARSAERNLNVALQSTEVAFGPLVDVCLSFLETRQIDEAKIVGLGYRAVTAVVPSFSRKLGKGIWNKVTVLFSARAGTCTMSAPAVVSSTSPMQAFVARELTRRGFSRVSPEGLRRSELVYARGAQTVVVSGFTYNGTQTLGFARPRS